MSKPTNKPGWNPTTNSTEPSSAKKAAGWSSGEKPSSAHFNWLMKTVSEWIEHIDAEGVQGPKGDTGPQGIQGEKGDTGPQGASGSISSADLARISALEGVSGIIAASPVTVTFPYNGGAAPSEYSIGDSGSSIAVNWANGASQFVTLTADATVSFTGGTAGNTYYLRIQQGGYGLKRVVGWPTNIVWNGGSVPTISTAAWTVDVIGCYYDGTNYYGYVSQGHFTAPSGSDTKNGYITNGSYGAGAGTWVGSVEKINFNSDLTLTVVQTEFSLTLNSSGSYIYPTPGSNTPQGTQSSTHGYRIIDTYSSLPTVSNLNSTRAGSKLPFSNDTNSIFFRHANDSFLSLGRRAMTQNATDSYSLRATTGAAPTLLRFNFSTDVASSPATNILSSEYGQQDSSGFSTSTDGIFVVTFSNLLVANLNFSTRTLSALSYATPLLTGYNAAGEGVDSQYNGYWQRHSGGPYSNATTSGCVKLDKSVYTQNILTTTLSGAGVASSSTQGNFAGYFCGGMMTSLLNYSDLTHPSSPAGVSTVKKIIYSPETYSIHSASLSSARKWATGFEG